MLRRPFLTHPATARSSYVNRPDWCHTVINFEDQKPIDVERTCERASLLSPAMREPSPDPCLKLDSEGCHLHRFCRCFSETINRLMHFSRRLRNADKSTAEPRYIKLGEAGRGFWLDKRKKMIAETACSEIVLIFRKAKH